MRSRRLSCGPSPRPPSPSFAFLAALGIGHSFLKFVTPLSYPSSEAGLAIGIWYVIGVVVLIYLYVRHPARLPEMRRVFDEETVPAAEPVPQ